MGALPLQKPTSLRSVFKQRSRQETEQPRGDAMAFHCRIQGASTPGVLLKSSDSQTDGAAGLNAKEEEAIRRGSGPLFGRDSLGDVSRPISRTFTSGDVLAMPWNKASLWIERLFKKHGWRLTAYDPSNYAKRQQWDFSDGTYTCAISVDLAYNGGASFVLITSSLVLRHRD